MIHLKELWCVLHRHWDNKDNISRLVPEIKYYLGINCEDYTQEDCIANLVKHHLNQRKKHVSNEMNDLHGLTL